MNNTTYKLRMTIDAGHAKPAPPLGPVLGQRGLNIREFCVIFNNKSAIYIEGLPLITDVLVDDKNQVEINILGVNMSYLLKMVVKNNKITIHSIYIISLFLKKYDSRFRTISTRSIISSVISTVLSQRLEITFVS